MEQLSKLRTMPVSAIMNKEVITIQGGHTVADALVLMKKHNISGLVVEPRNSDDTFGIVTEKDILAKVIDPGEDIYKEPWNTQIHLIMEKPCITVHPDMRVKYAIRLMRKTGIRRLVVMRDNKLVGILNMSHILHAVEDLPISGNVAT